MNHSFSKRSRHHGQALIGMLVAVFIVIAAAGIYLSRKGKNPDGSTSTHTALRRTVDLAQETALMSNLRQVQMFMTSYKPDNDGKPPATFDELKKASRFPAEMWINPVDKKPLDYNPQTGTMIVTPYEGESPQIIKMTTPQADGSTPGGAQSTLSDATTDAGRAPMMPKMPTIPGASGDVSDSQ